MAPPPSTGSLTGSRSPQRLAGTPGARVPVPAKSTSSSPTRPLGKSGLGRSRRVAYRGRYADAYPPSVDRYGADVLNGDWRRRGRPAPAQVPAEPGLVVEEAETGWCGAVARVE